MARLASHRRRSLDQESLARLIRLGATTALPYEWNAIGLWCRDHDGRTGLTEAGDSLMLEFPSDDLTRTVRTVAAGSSWIGVLGLLDHFGALERMSPLPEGPLPAGGSVVARVRDRNFADYVYELEQQVQHRGASFGRRRSYLRSMAARDLPHSIVPLDLTDAGDRHSILDVAERWREDREESPSIAAEEQALTRLVRQGQHLPVILIGVRTPGQLLSFGVLDVNGTYATAHFVKSVRDSAVNAATWHALFDTAWRAGARTLNAGYDGGVEGLRRAKTNLIPSDLRPKETWLLDD